MFAKIGYLRAAAVTTVCILCLACACQRQVTGPGSARITSTPSGATVFIDNQFVGLTPHVAQNLSPGVHSVKLEKSGYRRYFGVVTLGMRGAEVHAQMEAERSGEIRIASLPSDAAVFVNGQYRGRTVTTLSGLPAGGYELRLQLDNCDPWLRTVSLRTGEKITINAMLESPYERFLRDAIAKKPNEAANYTELARHYIVRKKYDQAAAVYRMALARREKSMESRLYQEIGKAYGGQFKSAESDADMGLLRTKIIRIFADAGNAMTFFASAQRWVGQFKTDSNPQIEKARLEKIQELEQSVAARPDDVSARLTLGKLYLDRRDTKRAQEQFKLVAQATENNWMTESEKQQEAAKRAKGLAKVDGRWVTPKEAERIALAKLRAEEKARRPAQGEANRVALEKARQEAELARRLAQEKAKHEAAELARKQQEKAKREAEELAKKELAEKAKGLAFAPKAFAPNEGEWALDTFQTGLSWQPETWADPAALKVVPSDSVKALNINYSGGKCAKACVSRRIPAPADCSSRGHLVLDVINNSNTLATLSVLITADQDYETQPQFVRPGGQQRLVFSIKGNNFKCKRDNWKQYSFPIGQPKNITRIAFMLNNPANLLVKNIKLTK